MDEYIHHPRQYFLHLFIGSVIQKVTFETINIIFTVVTDELVEFEKKLVQIQEFRKKYLL